MRRKYDNLFEPQWALSEFIIDFYAPFLQVAIEVDGSSHNREATKARDVLQERAVASVGGVTLRFSNDDVMGSLDTVLARIHEEVLRRAPTEKPKGAHKWRLSRRVRRELRAEREALRATP